MSSSHDIVPQLSTQNGVPPVAPQGFTDEQWHQFLEVGFMMLPGVLTEDEIAELLDAARELSAALDMTAKRYRVSRAVTRHQAFTRLIDGSNHIGYAYDLYGDQLRLVQSELFIRPPGGRFNAWHFDGPRATPFQVFSPMAPLKIKVGYWLTELGAPGCGNLVLLPGSHRGLGHQAVLGNSFRRGERSLICPPGTITLMNSDIWHRVEPNNSRRDRVNLFLSYSPSWIQAYDEHDAEWAATLPREQRIILRAYSETKHYMRPPAEDLPLFRQRPPTPEPHWDKNEEWHKIWRQTEFERHMERRDSGDPS